MMMMKTALVAKNIVSKARFGKIPSFSTVAANTIRITFVDQEGNRAVVPALIGKTLLEVAKIHKVDLEGPCAGGGAPAEVQRTEKWIETTYGSGPECFYCHVKIPSSFNHVLPRKTEADVEGLKETWEEEFSATSHLACQIILQKEHDGLVVLVPDAPPTDVI